MLKNKILQNDNKVVRLSRKTTRFHLNGHTIGFCSQSQKFKLSILDVSMVDSGSQRVLRL